MSEMHREQQDHHNQGPVQQRGLGSGPMNAFGALLRMAVGAGVTLVGAYALSRHQRLRGSDDISDRLQQPIAEVKSGTPEN
ncbi:MAG TPA: hypothetical protein VJ646_01890 [Candidatus Binatia bacterium]|nr:hypothetical protein [Candidatus Binatia bacterium]